MYASCSTPLATPGCAYDRGAGAAIKLLEEWLKLFLVPGCLLLAIKVLAHALLLLEDSVATWQVKKEAQKLLYEAARVEGGVSPGARKNASFAASAKGTVRAFFGSRRVCPERSAAPSGVAAAYVTQQVIDRCAGATS